MEVVKTRMQLQGELVLRSSSTKSSTKVYRNAMHAFYKICRDEGLRGIQAGLATGVLYQVSASPYTPYPPPPPLLPF